MHRLGSVTLDRVKTGRDLRKSLEGRLPETEVLLIKPNWYSPHPSNYTDADALRMVMEAVDAEVIVVEGYSLDRQDGSMSFTVDPVKVGYLQRGGEVFTKYSVDDVKRAEALRRHYLQP